MAEENEVKAEDKASVKAEVSDTKVADEMPPTYDEASQLTPGEPNVKITSNETKIDIGNEKEKEAFQGLTKEELMKYANDPFWVRLRWILFILFWIIWVAMLAASIVIIIYAPKCPSPEPKEWWQKNAMYKVDVKDFGSGTLDGLKDNLDLLVESGVGTVYLTSFFKNQGPVDANNFDSELGTAEDWESLVTGLKERDLKVLINWPTTYMKDKKEDDEMMWIEKGVNGFVFDENNNQQQEIQDLRDKLDKEYENTGERVVLVSEQDTGVPVQLHLTDGIQSPTSAQDLKSQLDGFMSSLPEDSWPSFEFSSKIAGDDMTDAMNMLKMLLPGTPVITPGDELGLPAWSPESAQTQQEAENSHLKIFSTLATKLRHQDSILFGEMSAQTLFVIDDVFGMVRVKKGNPGYLLLVNFGASDVEVDLTGTEEDGTKKVKYVPDAVRLMARSVAGGAEVENLGESAEEEIRRFESSAILMKAREGRVFTFVPNYD